MGVLEAKVGMDKKARKVKMLQGCIEEKMEQMDKMVETEAMELVDQMVEVEGLFK